MTENALPIRSDDDTEGHGRWNPADAETAEGGDTEGHVRRHGAPAETADDDEDVVGHVQPPRDFDR